MPRDIEESVGEIEEVYLYDLDTLKKQVGASVAKREAQVEECEKIIDAEVVQIIKQTQQSFNHNYTK